MILLGNPRTDGESLVNYVEDLEDGQDSLHLAGTHVSLASATFNSYFLLFFVWERIQIRGF